MFCGDRDMELYNGKRYLNKDDLIKREWTNTAIERLLGEPDRMRLNHLYKNTKPIKLYSENRVLKAEKTDDYQKFFQRKRKVRETRAGNKKEKN